MKDEGERFELCRAQVFMCDLHKKVTYKMCGWVWYTMYVLRGAVST